ncbi:MAG: hypothetical protein II931_04490, partial [Clostridia bacterium]|nr:hypothetical protein [Clostridia bacterium]
MTITVRNVFSFLICNNSFIGIILSAIAKCTHFRIKFRKTIRPTQHDEITAEIYWRFAIEGSTYIIIYNN